jgi:tetratricopeptide (TPR) repeat protein
MAVSRGGLRLCLLVIALVAAGCTRARPDDAKTVAGDQDAAQPVDPVLLAFLSKARAAHHRADAFEEQGQLERAVAELERITRGPLPAAAKPAPEVREVLADSRARTAELRSRLGQFGAALQDVAAGLELARERTYFRGHLFEVRGLVEERRSATLKQQGNETAAANARARALESFETAMQIQDEVIKQSLSAEPAP